MYQYIINIALSVVAPVRTFIQNVLNGLRGVWSTVVNIMTLLKRGWIRVVEWVNNWTIAAYYHGLAVYNALRNLIFVRIPRLLSILRTDLTNFFNQALNAAKLLLTGLINEAKRLLTLAINALRDFVNRILDWATRQINSLFDWVARLGRLVFSLLDDPRHLAEWVVGALWSALWRYLLKSSVPWGRILWRKLPNMTLTTTQFIEDLIVRIIGG